MSGVTYTYCQICEQACGLKVSTIDNRVVKIEPDRNNTPSWQDFCIKGASANKVLEHPNRLAMPMQRVRSSGGKGRPGQTRFVERSYDEAIADISSRVQDILAEHGADAIASYAGNPNGMDFGGSLFLSLFMDAIGSGNRFWVSSIDQNALHYVAEHMYGHHFATLQLDLDQSTYVLLLGGNPAVSGMCWIGRNVNGWKRLLARKSSGDLKLVIVDPVHTESAAKANEHLAVNPEQDWAFLLGLIKVIFEESLQHVDDCNACDNLADLRSVAESASLADLAQRCGIASDHMTRIAREFARANGAAALARTGTAMGKNGALTEWLSHALNLVTGNTDRPGGRFYNPGLVDPLVAGDEIFRPNKRNSRVRGLPTVAGFHALAELPDEIETPGKGQIRALFMSAGNPVVSGPQGHSLDAALGKLDLFVAMDLVQRESHRHADWLIPAAHWLERSEFNPLLSGLSDTPSAQMGKAAVTKPATIKHEWEFLRDLCLALEAPLLNKPGVNVVARVSRAIANLTGNPYHGFGPEWMARLLVARSKSANWRQIRQAKHGFVYGQHSTGALRANLERAGRRIDAAPVPLLKHLQHQLHTTPTNDQAYPLRLISKRRKQTMNSWYNEITAFSPNQQAQDEALGTIQQSNTNWRSGDWIDVHPELARDLDITDDDLVTVHSRTSCLQARVRLNKRVHVSAVIMEQGWGSRIFDASTGESVHRGVNRNLLVANDDLDPLTSVPRLNGTPVRIQKAVRN